MGGSVSKRNSEEAMGSAVRRDREDKRPHLMVRDASYPQSPMVHSSRPGDPALPALPSIGPAADPADLVQTVFRWDHGGTQVYITGTFNGWSDKVAMVRNGNEFTHIQGLSKRKHAYKFIVDEEWRFAPDQPTVADNVGNINNFIDLTNFEPDQEIIVSRKDTDPRFGPYADFEDDDVAQEPPALPPHLRQIILNAPVPLTSPHLLPTPINVMLNHLNCTTIHDKLMVQAVTQRYKNKCVTTVYYSVMPLSRAERLAMDMSGPYPAVPVPAT